MSPPLLLRNKNDLFLDRVVTCDEKWFLYDNRRRSAQWLDADEAPQHFSKPELYQKKVMLTVWWPATSLIHYSFLNAGKTITAEKYCQQMDEMHQKLRQHPALVNRKGPILLHDNARLHVAKPTLQKLNELGYETLPHPPYSPDLSPTNYHFFKHLDNFLREKCFKNLSDIKNVSSDFIATGIQDFLRYWHKYTFFLRWQKCVDSDRCLFRSINFCFELRYVHLNLKVKNCKNFLVNLIYIYIFVYIYIYVYIWIYIWIYI